MRRKAISYIRFSSAKQIGNNSLRRQLEATEKFCAENGLELDETLKDEAKSGYSGRHLRDGALGRFLERVRKGEIPPGTVLIVEALDRLSRQVPRIAQENFLGIINRGVEIVTLMDRQWYSKTSLDKGMGQIFQSIGIMIGAHAESHNKAERTIDAFQKRRTMVAGVHPGWIRPNADRTEWELIPEVVETINLIFERCANGWGADRIAATLVTDGVPPLHSNRRSRIGGWHGNTIRRLIRERTALGEVEIGEARAGVRRKTGKLVKRYPAAITEALWRNANDALLNRSRTGGQHFRKMVNLFQGLIVCGQCGGTMQTKKSFTRRYLTCRNAERALCQHKTWHKYPPIEEAIMSVYLPRAALLPEDSEDARTKIVNALAVAQRQAEDLETAYERAFGLLGDSPGPLAKRNLAKLEGQHADALRRVDELQAQLQRDSHIPRAEHLKRIMALWEQAKDIEAEEAQDIRAKINADLPRVVQSIVLMPDETISLRFVITEWKVPLVLNFKIGQEPDMLNVKLAMPPSPDLESPVIVTDQDVINIVGRG